METIRAFVVGCRVERTSCRPSGLYVLWFCCRCEVLRRDRMLQLWM